MTDNIVYSHRAQTIISNCKEQIAQLPIAPTQKEIRLIRESMHKGNRNYESANATACYQKGLGDKERYNYVVLLNTPFINANRLTISFVNLSQFIVSAARIFTGPVMHGHILYFYTEETRTKFLLMNGPNCFVLYGTNKGEPRKWSANQRNKIKQTLKIKKENSYDL